jgi:hypothetical protein
MGVYGSSTFEQGDPHTPPPHPIPKSSSCSKTSTIKNGAIITSSSIVPSTTTVSIMSFFTSLDQILSMWNSSTHLNVSERWHHSHFDFPWLWVQRDCRRQKFRWRTNYCATRLGASRCYRRNFVDWFYGGRCYRVVISPGRNFHTTRNTHG